MIELLNDTLPAENPYDSLDICYELSYFKGNPLLHPEACHSVPGFRAIPLDFHLWNDDNTALLLFVGFILFVILYKGVTRTLNTQVMDFFFPSRDIKAKNIDDKNSHQLANILSLMLLSLVGGIGTYIFQQLQADFFLESLHPCILVGLYTAAWLGYFLAKRMFYAFVNWIFFDKKDIFTWNQGQKFIFTSETLLFFPAVIIAVYADISIEIMLWIALTIVIISKILLLYKTLVIFFAKTYGGLHLFVYFCTLEVIPLLVFLKILIGISIESIVKF